MLVSPDTSDGTVVVSTGFSDVAARVVYDVDRLVFQRSLADVSGLLKKG